MSKKKVILFPFPFFAHHLGGIVQVWPRWSLTDDPGPMTKTNRQMWTVDTTYDVVIPASDYGSSVAQNRMVIIAPEELSSRLLLALARSP